MKTLQQQLSQYALYHRDKRNIATHFIGIPMIVLAIVYLLYFPMMEIGQYVITPALIVVALSSGYYLILSRSLGLVMSVILASMYYLVEYTVDMLTSGFPLGYLGFGVVLFIVGWVFQFVGHYFEGKKPAFVDDLMGLVIGPLFVLVEALFCLGLFKSLEHEIIERAGAYR
ncbi:FIG028593: membrane protein [Pseudoalteromonas luteoviolacea B = ATCC 29581]|nr:FIG028593: membrane protein [Pseudoalteromonas luteoviolacea B = ATCC 29581]